MFLFFVACGVAPKQKAVEILEKGINDESIIVRVHAAKALRQIGEDRGLDLLYQINRSGDQEGCAAALRALYDLDEGTYSPELWSYALEGDPSIRIEAYKLIASMKDERCRDMLIKGTDDKIAKIRRISYLGLEKFKEDDVLRGGLRDIDPLVRIAAAKALGRTGEQDLKDFIRNELNGTENDVWCHGIIALAEMGDTSVIHDIGGRLYSAPWEVRLAAVEALLIMNNHDGVLVLQEALQSDDPFAREYAVNILKKYKISETTQLLKDVVHDEYTNVSVAAIEALVQYGAKEQQRLFEEMMNVPNPLVQIAAAAAYLQGE
jgi:HEAT repeat protein